MTATPDPNAHPADHVKGVALGAALNNAKFAEQPERILSLVNYALSGGVAGV